MKLRHTEPCKECPWRKNAPQGYLGGFTAEFYADAVAMNESPACHLNDHGPDNARTSFCAGALAVMANACILPDQNKSPGAHEARDIVGRRDDCFFHPAMFYEYHSGNDWVHPILRMFDQRK